MRWLNARERRAWLELVRIMTLLPTTLDAQLRRDSDLNQYEYIVLGRLAERTDRTMGMKALAVVTNGSLSRLSHVVKRLEADGYAYRESHPSDGRLTRVVLTDKGFQKVTEAAPGHVREVRRHVFDHLTAEDVAQLGELLSRIAPDASW